KFFISLSLSLSVFGLSLLKSCRQQYIAIILAECSLRELPMELHQWSSCSIMHTLKFKHTHTQTISLTRTRKNKHSLTSQSPPPPHPPHTRHTHTPPPHT